MYSEIFDLHASILKALSHPRRLEIIQLLQDQELSVADIYTMLDLPQANISQHLMILRDVQIVETRREGKQIFYKITDKKIIRACELIREFLIDLTGNTELKKTVSIKMKDLFPVVHDPVCKMRLSPKTASYSYTHNHTEHFFCASGCLKKFKEEPTKYVN